MMMLTDRVALVTGASTGIGRATAKILAAAGAKVGLAARSRDKLKAVQSEIKADGGEALALPTDVRDRAQIVAAVDKMLATLGTLDILVNNAGVGHWESESVTDANPDAWRDEIEINLLGVIETTLAVMPAMLAQGSGHIVNVSTLGVHYAYSSWAGYMASKSGVGKFTQTIMNELRRQGIRVTLVEPGQVDTPMVAGYIEEGQPILKPEDIADAILYAVTRPPHVCVNDMQIISVDVLKQ
jgi:NADP-dependent 3-hydroxy acid dehydrogenase YdfG